MSSWVISLSAQLVGDTLKVFNSIDRKVERVIVNNEEYVRVQRKGIKRTHLLDGSWIDEEVER